MKTLLETWLKLTGSNILKENLVPTGIINSFLEPNIEVQKTKAEYGSKEDIKKQYDIYSQYGYLADYLEDHDDSRYELVRSQIERMKKGRFNNTEDYVRKEFNILIGVKHDINFNNYKIISLSHNNENKYWCVVYYDYSKPPKAKIINISWEINHESRPVFGKSFSPEDAAKFMEKLGIPPNKIQETIKPKE